MTVRVLRRVGHFVPEGVPLLMVSRGDKLSPARAEALRAVFEFGPTRTLQQDVEYGILQIVDIALKAISPAVNDPSTAIGCVDQLSRILIRFAMPGSRRPRSCTTRRASSASACRGSRSTGSSSRPSSRSAFMPSLTWLSACGCCAP